MSEVASAFVTLVPSAKGFRGGIEREIGGDLDRAGRDGGKRYGNATKSAAAGVLTKAGPLLAAAFTGAAAGAVVGFMASAVGAASDLNETINKTNVIFGGNAATIRKWSEGAAQNLGLSQQAALDAASGFGDMLSQIGFGGAEAAKLSTGIVTLSADLGSFNNLPTEDVAQRIASAFRGEYDSLQALIPNINAARVESEALAMTGKTVATELTAQEKAAATLAIVQRDGARAAGDFEKTSGGLANQQKILKAEFDNVKTAIGQELLPVAQSFMAWVLASGVPALKDLVANVKANKEQIKALALQTASMALIVAEGFLRMGAVLLQQLARATSNLRLFVSGMITFADGVLSAAEKAFGWIPGVGDKISTARGHLATLKTSADRNLGAVEQGFRTAAGAAEKAADKVGEVRAKVDSLNSKTITITVNERFGAVARSAGIGSGSIRERALGGPVSKGRAYLVGERRPEVFVPDTNGTILPRVSDLTRGARADDGMPGGAMAQRGPLVVVQNMHVRDEAEAARRLEAVQRDALVLAGVT